jgi:hypothetical protein
MALSDPGTVVPDPGTRGLVSRRRTLDGFVREVACTDGVELNRLDPITTLRVRTANSLYLITVVNPLRCEVLVQGGKFFQDRTRLHFSGSTFGGSCLKLAWIGIGMRMEFHGEGEGGWVRTSRVLSISVQPATSVRGPF